MELNLQTVIDILKNSIHLSEEEKTSLISKLKETDKKISITEFKLDRTEKVKRTTAILLEETIEELEQKRKAVEEKNHELEIENALEKVRAIALSMKEPADMPEVCKIIATELEKLGVKEIRNVQTAIFYDNKGTYMNYEYYARHNKSVVTETSYTNHKIHQAFADQMLKGKGEFFSTHINEAELPGWVAYQKTTNVFIDTYLETASSLNYYWYSLGPVALGISTYIVLSEKETNLFKRFRNVFELAYRRFLDIELAIGQAREARIETALERVRAVAMAMKKSEELLTVCEVMYKELLALGFTNTRNAQIAINEGGYKAWLVFEYSEYSVINMKKADSNVSPLLEEIAAEMSKSKDALFQKQIAGKEFEEWRNWRVNADRLNDPRVTDASAMCFYLYGVESGILGISTFDKISNEQIETLKRFKNVFELSYRRYADVAKAEAQSRESQIQLGLERVRARTMAMQQSNELTEVAAILFKQINDLGIKTWTTGFNVWSDDDNAWTDFITTPQGNVIESYTIDARSFAVFKEVSDAKKSGVNFYIQYLEGDLLNETYKRLAGFESEKQYEKMLEDGFEFPERQYNNFVFGSQVSLMFITYESVSEVHDIFKRFGNVFEQTYTRFLDLQKAEAQSRESQIQLALERVRARTMAMQKSDELAETAALLFSQFKDLGHEPDRITIGIMQEEKQILELWATNGEADESRQFYQLPFNEPHVLAKCVKAWKEQKKSLVLDLYGKPLKEYTEFWKSLGAIEDARSAVDQVVFNFAFFSKGYLGFISFKHVPSQTIEILERFAGVFDLTYTRFLDLEKAEAQTREAQIELSLERVRAKTMAMHNSTDVGETAAAMVDELKKLGIETIRCGIGIMHEPGDMEVWTISTDENSKTDIIIGWLDMNMHPLLHGAFESWRNKVETYSYELKDDDLLNYYNAINNYPGYPIRYNTSDLPKQIHHNEFHFAEGTLFAFSPHQLTDEQRKIFKRFAGVFGQTYRRYLDLQKAENSAKESQIEAALERVRSRTLAMQKSDELAETSAVLFKQLIQLGISPNRLYISIIKDDAGDTEFWITDEDGNKVSMAYEGNLNNNPSFKKMYNGWKQQKKSLILDMKGKKLKEYLNYLQSIFVPFKGGLTQKRRVQYIAYFSKGFIGMASPDEQPAATLQLLERFAYVFNLTFTRFNDLQIAEAHAVQAEHDIIDIKAAREKAEDTLSELQVTQKQLIQSEKMASLGELTAGIAHEIQNPLNFVNNFSEVNSELIDELEQEADKGNIDEVKAIAKDIRDNEQKINHHGKRADAIVKGMLQHSRQTSGTKEPTDINALCDEYLRLSYHGLHAKDKNFNADFKTDFNDSISKINIVPQDIGRVLLNLYNNAFYATNAKLKTAESYKPIVSVQTKKMNDNIEIKVTDNGNGIPQNIIDKIFQPFFTTKPTGEGTGLGLSLAYDIITKEHNGTLKVESKEGEGSVFIILLPV